MSMSCAVLSRRPLSTTDEWQRSLDELGFELRLEPGENRPVAMLRGHLPAVWKGREAGFECYPGGAEEAAEIAEQNEELGSGGPWGYAIDIVYWGYAGCAGAMMAAVAYARVVDGVLYEGEAGVVIKGENLVPFARQSVADMWDCMVWDGET